MEEYEINYKKRYIRYIFSYAALTVTLVILFICALNAGSVAISVKDVFRILFAGEGNEAQINIIWQIRMPRIIAACVLGGELSLSGFLLQTFFRNPIAGPFVLGISSGAKLTVALSMIVLINYGFAVTSWFLISAAFAGSLLSMCFVLIISRKVSNMSMLIVSGVMIGYICSAITDFVVTFADDSDIANMHNWSLGSFSGIDWENVKVIAAVAAIAVTAVFLCAKPVGAYQLGEAYARNMGVNIKLFRGVLIVLSSILSACVTAFAGPVSFVGIAVPHIVKSLMKTSKPILIIPACFLGGAAFCLFCDLVARTLFAPTELSISTVTAVFGAPVVIFIMLNKKKQL